MTFKAVIISPICQPEDYCECPLLTKDINAAVSEHEGASCLYVTPRAESSLHHYAENYAIISFNTEAQAQSFLEAVRNGTFGYNGFALTATPVEEYYAPALRLTEDCLMEIFHNLSVYEHLKLDEVCTRWKAVCEALWKKITSIDLRKPCRLNRKLKYIIKSSPYLKEIHCYENQGLKTIGKYCDNLENIAIEFREYAKRDGLDIPCTQIERHILPHFNHLTRLMLKCRNILYTYFAFVPYLPVTMIEIHFLNDCDLHDDNVWKKKTLDLSKFSNLRALTLKNFTFDDGGLLGFAKLRKVTCLCLDYCSFSPEILDFFSNLEHLSLQCSVGQYGSRRGDHIWSIVIRNVNLRFLALSDVSEFRHRVTLCRRALTMQHLKVLSWYCVADDLVGYGGSTSVEYLDLYRSMRTGRLRDVLAVFPNLRVLKLREYFTEETATEIEHYIVTRTNPAPFKYCYEPRERRDTSIFNTENFEHSDHLSPEDAKVFRSDYWNGWYIEDDSLPEPSAATSNTEKDMDPLPENFEELSDECLSRIFSFLPLEDRLTVGEVCKKWKRISNCNWGVFKKFDVRDLTHHRSVGQCMLQCGKYFKDVYAYKSCGSRDIRTHCINVERLAVDFGAIKCECDKPLKHRYSLDHLPPMLASFASLTCIMLKDIGIFEEDLLRYLPKHMMEIHIFNKYVEQPLFEGVFSKPGDHLYTADLSKYTNLRALSLVDTEVPYLSQQKVTTVIEPQNLDKLIHLRLANVTISKSFEESLEKIQNLEYLTLISVNMSHRTFENVIGNNDRLQFLDIRDRFQRTPPEAFWPILLLKHLKCLRLVNLGSCGSQWVPPVDRILTDELETLEVLDCTGYNRLISATSLVSLIAGSRRLKVVNITVGPYRDRLLERNWPILRDNSLPEVIVIVGSRAAFNSLEAMRESQRVRFRELSPIPYRAMADMCYWRGWAVDKGEGTTRNFCADLVRAIRG